MAEEEFTLLPMMITALQDFAENHAQQTAEAIALDASGRAPVRTGELADSIHAAKGDDGEWDVVVGAPYAEFVEYGTRHMAAEPFLTPAADAAASAFAEMAGLENALGAAK